jgi:hypothetical protein
VDLFSRSGSRIGHTLVCTVGFLQNHYVYVGSYGIVLGAFPALAGERSQVWPFRYMGIFGTHALASWIAEHRQCVGSVQAQECVF